MFDTYSQVKKVSIGIGVAVIILLLISGVIWYWIRSAEKTARQLAIAEEKEKRADVLFEESKRIQGENAKLIESLIEQQTILAESMVKRNQTAERAIVAARAPKSTEQVVKDSTATLGFTPVVRDNSLAFTTAQVQEIIAKELDRVRLEQNLKDTQNQLVLEREKVAKYEVTLAQANQLIIDQREVIEAYKKLAKKTGWQKVSDVGQKIGGVVIGGLIAAALTR